MRKPFYKAMEELALLLEPGTLLEWPAEPCIVYEVLPHSGTVIVKFDVNTYGEFRGDGLVKLLLMTIPDYLPDEKQLAGWRAAASAWRKRPEQNKVDSRIQDLIWEEFYAMVWRDECSS